MSILSNRTSENEQNILKRFPLPKKGYQFNKILKMRKTHQQKGQIKINCHNGINLFLREHSYFHAPVPVLSIH